VASINHVIQSKEFLRNRFAKNLNSLEEQVKSSPHLLYRLEHTIRRYQALADAVKYAKEGDEEKPGSSLSQLLLLFDEREIIVKKIEALFRPCAISRFVLQNIERYLGRPPSSQEREALEKKHKMMMKVHTKKIAALNEALFDVEAAILKDRRPWHIKYAPLAATALIGAALFFGASTLFNRISALLKSSKEKQAPDARAR